jgi:hypothetical protein
VACHERPTTTTTTTTLVLAKARKNTEAILKNEKLFA